jgi:hypothetical protein
MKASNGRWLPFRPNSRTVDERFYHPTGGESYYYRKKKFKKFFYIFFTRLMVPGSHGAERRRMS